MKNKLANKFLKELNYSEADASAKATRTDHGSWSLDLYVEVTGELVDFIEVEFQGIEEDPGINGLLFALDEEPGLVVQAEQLYHRFFLQVGGYDSLDHAGEEGFLRDEYSGLPELKPLGYVDIYRGG